MLGQVMKLRKNRAVERAAVNAARAFFESNGCVFQEVDLGNDYGKDAYVDFVHDEHVTGICFALQIKGGASYRRGTDYGIPLHPGRAELWLNSTVPVIGIVHDPEDGKLRWCNISAYLHELQDRISSYIPVSANAILTADTLRLEIIPNLERMSKLHPVLNVLSDSHIIKHQAIYDCFGIGRADARVLIALRYLLKTLDRDSMYIAIHVLTHVTPHPDIFWHADNWITTDVKDRVRKHFIWEISEIIQMLSAVTWEHWARGDIGEDLYMILREDPGIERKMEQAAHLAMDKGEDEAAFTALYLSVYWSADNGIERYREMTACNPKLRGMMLLPEIEYALHEFGYLTLF
jgi:hypothetical protein